jgi:hypothetical protein
MFTHLNSAFILAQQGLGSREAEDRIRGLQIWGLLETVAAFFGVMLVLFGLFKIGSQVWSGKSQGAFKTGALTILTGAALFSISIVFDLLRGGGSILRTLIETFTSLVG